MSGIHAPPTSQRTLTIGRVLLAIIGGYVAASATVAALSVGLAAMGMPPSEAGMLTVMLGVVIYLALLIWGFATRRLAVTAALWTAMVIIAFGAAELLGRG